MHYDQVHAKQTYPSPCERLAHRGRHYAPGVILHEDFLAPMGVTAHHLALSTRMPATRIGEILHARRAVSPDTALRLTRYFGTSPEFWLNLQAAHDLSKVRRESGRAIQREVEPYSLEAAS
jgi:addiction module HigA family antidote